MLTGRYSPEGAVMGLRNDPVDRQTLPTVQLPVHHLLYQHGVLNFVGTRRPSSKLVDLQDLRHLLAIPRAIVRLLSFPVHSPMESAHRQPIGKSASPRNDCTDSHGVFHSRHLPSPRPTVDSLVRCLKVDSPACRTNKYHISKCRASKDMSRHNIWINPKNIILRHEATHHHI